VSSPTEEASVDEVAERSVVDRLRASQFLSELASNRLALLGAGILAAMLVTAV
jgi:peptide/nickel transport system permease protein